MSYAQRDTETASDELKSYVEDIVIEALRDETISPSTFLECIYYAVEPDLIAAIRALAALDPDKRCMVVSYAKWLSQNAGNT
jgi:hypothetical protein